MWKRGKIASVVITLEVCIIIVFVLKSYYGNDANASDPMHNLAPALSGQDPKKNSIADYSQSFEDMLKLTFLTSGMAISSMNDFVLSGIGLNLLLIGMTFQFCLLLSAIFSPNNSSFVINIDVHSIMNSLLSCYTVSITLLSSLSGKFSILQLIFTLAVYSITYTIYFNFTAKYDIYELTTGKFFHNLLYGSYFTIGALAFVNFVVARLHLTSTSNVNSGTPTPSHHTQRKCNYNSNIMNQLILLGSIVLLYTFYPFVLSANVFGDKRHRIVINTLLALTASTVTSFALTSIIDPKNRFNVRLIQVGIYSGASAITSVAGLMIHPYGALLIGFIAPILAVITFLYLLPFLSKVLHFEDRFYHTCSHCIPLLFGGLALTVYSFVASEYEYGHTLYELFPARSPVYNSSDLEEILINLPHIQPGHARSASHQALLQFILLIVTILIGVIIGALTALVAMRVKLFDPLNTGSFFTDSVNWHLPLNDASVFGNESNANLSNCTDACDRGGKDESTITG